MITTDSDPPSSEADLLEIIASELRAAGITSDLTDDCAHLTHETSLVSTDTLIETIHFDLHWDTPRQIGRQAAIVNLSDLAGSGGAAGWLLWSLALPESWSRTMVRELTAGFAQVAVETGADVIGGNLASTPGPATIGVTVGGPLAGPLPLTRDRASPGDSVYVSGPLGERSLGYLMPCMETRATRHQWRPHLREARYLANATGVGACMDISDGLLKDAARLASASDVLISLNRSQLPLSDAYRQRCEGNDVPALTGGEDYVLLFTARPETPLPDWAIPIGMCADGRGVTLDGQEVDTRGYDHFVGAE